MNEAFDNLHNALVQLWDSIYDAFTVRIFGGRVAVWQVFIAIELLAWVVLAVAGYLR